MKFFRSSFFLIACMALAIGLGTLRAETPTEAVDRIWNTWDFVRGNAKVSQEKIMALNKAIAREQGVAVITPIMARSKDWKSEEALIFVPVVALLPRDKTVSILNDYKKNGKSWEQQAATDF